MPRPRPAFRPDIEGLRGVAILLVVLFHAGVSWLSGGFVGVDVFFVLSGYFITAVLLREAEDGLSLMEFWGRRSLRLLPPLLVVLFATLAWVMLLYAPIDRADVARTARAVALSSSNIHVAESAVDYFSSGQNPLLHTWSLAVEQQFYIVWPLLFLTGAFALRRSMLMIIGIVGLLSFIACIWVTTTAQPWAFYGMPTRLWEFALGGALALVMGDDEDQPEARGVVLQLAGLVAIAASVILYDRATPYPGFNALMPALGAAALLIGGVRAPDSRISRVLSTPVLRWVGRMSYAWYLWHWPLVGLGAVLDRDIGVAGKLVWSTVALVLAWLTYHVVERSARDGRLSRMPTHWLAPVSLAATLSALLIAHGATVAAERRAAAPDQRVFAAAREDRMEHSCWATTIDEPRGPCAFGDVNSTTTIMLLGDSHAEHWLGALDRLGRERGWRIVAMVKGGCPVADMPDMMHARLKRYYHECTRYRAAMVDRIIAERPAAVILSSWDHYIPPADVAEEWQVTAEQWESGLRRTYSRIAAAGLPLIVIRGTPRTWFNVPSCLSRRAAGLPWSPACEYDRERSLSPSAVAAQDRAAEGLDVRFVDMNDVICATKRCDVVRKGVIVFTDDNHLTASFSRSVAPELGERLVAAMR
jgi:peptidoglycan/LPS O-acetylase OafA/YrhL